MWRTGQFYGTCSTPVVTGHPTAAIDPSAAEEIPAESPALSIRTWSINLANAYTVSNCSAERFRLDERFERWSISTPITSFDSL